MANIIKTKKLIIKIQEVGSINNFKLLVEKLKLLSREIGPENILVLASSGDSQKIKILNTKNSIPFHLFYFDKTNVLNSLDRIHQPYCFVIDSTGECSDFIIIDGLTAELTDLYFEEIKEGFRKNMNNYQFNSDSLTSFRYTIEPTTFSNIKPNQNRILKILVENTGNNDLLIKSVYSDCNCMIVKSPLYPIKKGEIVPIEAKITFSGSPGKLNNIQVKVAANTKEGQTVINLAGIFGN